MIGYLSWLSTVKHGKKLSFEFLYERGFVPMCVVGVGNTIYNKWGLELDIHMDFVCCQARVSPETRESKYITYEGELIEIEKQFKIDQTPNLLKMSVEDLKKLIPAGYEYKIDRRRKYVKAKSQISYTNERGRFKIVKDGEVICHAYNDQDEAYFLCKSLMYILKEENLLLKNAA